VTDQLVVVGAGGHGREVWDVARRTREVRGFVDDGPIHHDRLERLGAVLLGDLSWLETHPGAIVLGVGSSTVRRRLAGRLAAAGCTTVNVLHPGASIGSDVRLGTGVVVFDRCTLTTNVQIGDHTHLNVGCAVQHDSVVGTHVQFSPGVLVNGECVIGDDVFLGTGAIVTRGCTIGDGARVGAGAVVLSDVAPGATVVGAPARPSRPV
jgi:sugar O-acyltransferase (sialic acid O-acetyltransferase NeuD family)